MVNLYQLSLHVESQLFLLFLITPCKITSLLLDYFTVPLHSPNGRHLPAIMAVRGDCQSPGVRGVCQTVGIPTSHFSP